MHLLISSHEELKQGQVGILLHSLGQGLHCHPTRSVLAASRLMLQLWQDESLMLTARLTLTVCNAQPIDAVLRQLQFILHSSIAGLPLTCCSL